MNNEQLAALSERLREFTDWLDWYREAAGADKGNLDDLRAAISALETMAETRDNALEAAAQLFDKYTYGPYGHPSGPIRALKSKSLKSTE